MDFEDVGEWFDRENCSLYIGEEWIKFDAWSRAMTWYKSVLMSIPLKIIIKYNDRD